MEARLRLRARLRRVPHPHDPHALQQPAPAAAAVTAPEHELRIADVLTFLAVYRHGSVTGAARDLAVSPSQVSKAVARLERHLKRPLLARRARGVAPSEDAVKLVPRLEELVEKIRAL